MLASDLNRYMMFVFNSSSVDWRQSRGSADEAWFLPFQEKNQFKWLLLVDKRGTWEAGWRYNLMPSPKTGSPTNNKLMCNMTGQHPPARSRWQRAGLTQSQTFKPVPHIYSNSLPSHILTCRRSLLFWNTLIIQVTVVKAISHWTWSGLEPGCGEAGSIRSGTSVWKKF